MDIIWLTIVLMAGITFYCRYLFLANALTFKLGGPIKRMLQFAAPSVLTAMWVPIVFMSDEGQLTSGLDDPFLLAGIGTIALSLVTRKTIVVVGLGIGLFVAAKMVLGEI
ncbi:hypothetical protein BTA51_13740 [Hahella sp. CCB-MM4]|uniref:AzlD domain-containing protein n=1 Tax=Hahella sp. (strain CCB-MM4) TaxID=1926491 RepID=UPI000B9A3F83|nr:AzlD domain-containing protein [Hahella sp. CCB-MM4]OZG73012.1 hypothetical protein BTA51_13740 [Hahella sp. CCB-MM4]